MDTDEITITIGKDEGMKHNSARSRRQEQGDKNGHMELCNERRRWDDEQNYDTKHTICPDAPLNLLSPQHWSQQSQDPGGTFCFIQHKKMILTVDGDKYTKHLQSNKINNSGFIKSLPTVFPEIVPKGA